GSVFSQHAALDGNLRLLPARAAAGQLGVVYFEGESLGVGVDGDRVAVLDEGNRPADPRLWSDVTDHQAVRPAGEAAVGDQPDALAESLPDQRRRYGQHLAHARPADRALATDDDHVARLDVAPLDCGEAGPLAVEDAGRAGEAPLLQSRHLRHRPIRRQVALQNDEVPFRVQRPVQRSHDFLAVLVDALDGREVLRQRLAGDG